MSTFEIMSTIRSQLDWLGICDSRLRLVEQTTHPRLLDYSSRIAIRGSIHKDVLHQYQNPWINRSFDPLCWGGRGSVTVNVMIYILWLFTANYTLFCHIFRWGTSERLQHSPSNQGVQGWNPKLHYLLS